MCRTKRDAGYCANTRRTHGMSVANASRICNKRVPCVVPCRVRVRTWCICVSVSLSQTHSCTGARGHCAPSSLRHAHMRHVTARDRASNSIPFHFLFFFASFPFYHCRATRWRSCGRILHKAPSLPRAIFTRGIVCILGGAVRIAHDMALAQLRRIRADAVAALCAWGAEAWHGK